MRRARWLRGLTQAELAARLSSPLLPGARARPAEPLPAHPLRARRGARGLRRGSRRRGRTAPEPAAGRTRARRTAPRPKEGRALTRGPARASKAPRPSRASSRARYATGGAGGARARCLGVGERADVCDRATAAHAAGDHPTARAPCFELALGACRGSVQVDAVHGGAREVLVDRRARERAPDGQREAEERDPERDVGEPARARDLGAPGDQRGDDREEVQ